ncbi:GNAT family N-acetyltransferase [Streptomyces sp. NPDC050095]|uniref:GNAT family N-acetyltransferase n=1 Tax=unclassified Streptomyces TaxID=2593676 RepID=UPI00341DC92A
MTVMTATDRPSPFIECGDLTLRRWRERSDFQSAFTLIGESVDHLRPWMPWVDGHSERSTRDFLANSESKWASGVVYNYAVVSDGTPLGMSQSYRVGETRVWRLGYWLHPSATGRGLATRATAALATEMFTLPYVDRLEILHDPANRPSAGVPRRLGFVEVGREGANGDGDVIWRLDRPGVR